MTLSSGSSHSKQKNMALGPSVEHVWVWEEGLPSLDGVSGMTFNVVSGMTFNVVMVTWLPFFSKPGSPGYLGDL